MSSARKDARWQLATDMLSHTSKDMDDSLPYPVREIILGAANEVLNCLSQDEVQALSVRFNANPEMS